MKTSLSTEGDTQFANYTKYVSEVYHDWTVIASALKLDSLALPWQMEYCERAALTFVRQNLKPAVSIEIGTASGGTLAVLSRFSKKVFSFRRDDPPAKPRPLRPWQHEI